MTNYCHHCRKIENVKKDIQKYSDIYELVIVTCEKCGIFLYQYLNFKKDIK